MSTPLPRSQFPALEAFAYLDSARLGPLPSVTRDAMAAYLDERVQGSPFSTAPQRINDGREQVARFFGAAPEEVAFVKNTTEGISFVAHGLEWKEGDRVVVGEKEHPAVAYPWLALHMRRIRIDYVPMPGDAQRIDIPAIEQRLAAGGVRVVAVSWVQNKRGFRTDLEVLSALCRRHRALLCVDLIQGAGLMRFDFAQSGADFATASGFKWLLGPEGIGILLVRRNLVDALQPVEFGNLAVAQPNADALADGGPRPSPTATRFEGGTLNAPGIFGLLRSLRLIEMAGPDDVWAYARQLRAYAVDELSQAGANVLSDSEPGHESGILSFDLPGFVLPHVLERLHQDKIACSLRGGAIRLSIHGFNTRQDIDRVTMTLARLRRSAGRSARSPRRVS